MGHAHVETRKLFVCTERGRKIGLFLIKNINVGENMREDGASRYFEQRVDFHQLWAINAEMDAAVDDLRKKIEFHFDRRLCSTSELRYYKKKADDHANNLKRVFGKIHTHDYTLEHVLNLSRETYLKKVLKIF